MKNLIRKILKEEIIRKKIHMDLPNSVLKMNQIFKENGYELYVVGGAVRDLLYGSEPKDFDLIVEYKDKWRWDFKKILDELEIKFITPNGKEIISKSNFIIYKNKELHNFPSPEKEVPKMIKELLKE